VPVPRHTIAALNQPAIALDSPARCTSHDGAARSHSVNILENEPLRLHTTLRVGGPARFFVEASTPDALQDAFAFARKRGLPSFVLGGGSNVLAGDAGYPGVVVKIATRGLQVMDMSANGTEVVAEAGEDWDALVAFAVERGLYGLENLSLIPGRVGAAIVGNIGAYGAEVKDTFVWADALDRRTGKQRRFCASECAFAYRDSFFKTPEGRSYVILRAAFNLRRDGQPNTSYRDVREHFSARGVTAPTLAAVREAVIAVRQRKLPDLSRIGTAGSFFKNPVIPRAQYDALAARYPGLPGHDEGNGLMKVPLGWVLDKVCGLKGVRPGSVGTHSEQALVLINDGGTATEIERFAGEAARLVHERTALNIEWEVERIV